ncbi:MAG: SUMF1/EgtB/PvdO family nonheme iron enzyme [Alphaproteobacteria bacterium]|nr:SUMF1/EgtB/PvdO family nonheme iron enzyme [Alphaproteobacteria bacterium]
MTYNTPVMKLILSCILGISLTSFLIPPKTSNFENKHSIQIIINEPDMIFVQGGEYTMGCVSTNPEDCYTWNQPSHQVTLSDFYISKYEVTQALYKNIMLSNPSNFIGDSLPVDNVTFDQAIAFILELNRLTNKKYRLPTEAEWEYAGEGGKKSKGFIFAGSNVLNEVAWHHENSNHTTHHVGMLKPNELGIYDMSGNVWEMCFDWYADYTTKPQINPRGPFLGDVKVMRGGSWELDNDQSWDTDFRGIYTPNHGDNDRGFRLVIGTND